MDIKNLVNRINVYDLMLFNLMVFSIIGMVSLGWKITLPQLAIAVLTAGILDIVINYFITNRFELSKSGIITGFFVGLVLANNQPWYVPLTASAIAVIGKHIGNYFMKLLKQRGHVFNPAMAGVFLSVLIFKTTDGWWGAINIFAVLILGLFLLYKFKRFHQIIPFLISYFIVLFLLELGFGDVSTYRYMLVDSTLYFFAIFMFIEPVTSPNNLKGRVIYGIIGGIIVAVTMVFLPPYTLTAGLLICNLFVPFVNYFVNRTNSSPA